MVTSVVTGVGVYVMISCVIDCWFDCKLYFISCNLGILRSQFY